jgi:hypothetical protein
MELLAIRRSSVLVIEGDFGMGKTELLVNFAQSVLPSRSTIFCAGGNPFTRAMPYVVWGDILTQYLVKFQVCFGRFALCVLLIRVVRWRIGGFVGDAAIM